MTSTSEAIITEPNTRLNEQQIKEDGNSEVKIKQYCEQRQINGYTKTNGYIMNGSEINGIKQGIYLKEIENKEEEPRTTKVKQDINLTKHCPITSDVLERKDVKQEIYFTKIENSEECPRINEVLAINDVKQGSYLTKIENTKHCHIMNDVLERTDVSQDTCVAKTDNSEECLRTKEILERNDVKQDTYLTKIENGKQCPIMKDALEKNGVESGMYFAENDDSGQCPKMKDVLERNGTTQGIYLTEIDDSEPSPRMKELLEGVNEPGDCGNPAEPPPWLDRNLFERGRQFYNRFLICIFFSDLLALVMMFSINRILRPLIYTGKSDTPWKALKRYVSTITHVIKWYSGDVWNKEDDAHKDVLRVRSIHTKYANMFNSSTHHPRVDEVSVYTKGHTEPECPFSSDLRRDLQCQVWSGYKVQDSNSPILYVSQWDMLVTQYSFMGLIVSHPRQLGAWWATDEELEGFVHFWRGLGWLLGTEDRFNFCSGSLEETRALCLEMEQRIMAPSIASADWSYEHMCNALLNGMSELIPGLNFTVMMRYLGDLIGFRVPSLTQRMKYAEGFRYWLIRFFLHVMFIIPGVVPLFNGMLKGLLDVSTGQQIPLWLRWMPKSWLPPLVKPHSYS